MNKKLSPTSSSTLLKSQTKVQVEVFSSTVLQVNVISVGVSFAFVTVILNCFSKYAPPKSVLLTKIERVDFVSKSIFQLT